MHGQCPQDELLEAVATVGRLGPRAGIEALGPLRVRYPEDARVLFLEGSLLAADGDFAAARAQMARAVELEPAFRIARFQLGFLDYTSGDAGSAIAVWQKLRDAEEGDPLRLFVEGLDHFARDDFAAAIPLLRRGIEANRDNPPLNADMQRLIDAVAPGGPDEPDDDEPASLAQLALRQSAARNTRH
jgi:Flp pilus assembly protein TadD